MIPRTFLTAVLILLAVPSSFAALKSQAIEYQDGDTVLEAYLAYDDAQAGSKPDILLVHKKKCVMPMSIGSSLNTAMPCMVSRIQLPAMTLKGRGLQRMCRLKIMGTNEKFFNEIFLASR